MRVLHVLPHRGGGAETYLDLLERLDGFDQERVALSRARTPLRAAPSILGGWPRAASRAAGAGLVHAHGDVAAVLALPVLRARPSVWTTHGLHALRRATGIAGATLRAGIRRVVHATAVTLCCSDAERQELTRLLHPRFHQRLRVVPNGIDLPPEPSAELDTADPSMSALYLGQLEERKDPLTAVRAANLAVRAGKDVRLAVAGDGPLLDAVRREAGEAVAVLGHRQDVDALLRAADVFVLPSRREGLSFAVLEAMGHGLAMIVADEPGNREAVGPAGIVLPAGDADAFATALVDLAIDPVRRAELGRAARHRVASHFTAERMIDGVRTAYAEATEPGRGAGDVPA